MCIPKILLNTWHIFFYIHGAQAWWNKWHFFIVYHTHNEINGTSSYINHKHDIVYGASSLYITNVMKYMTHLHIYITSMIKYMAHLHCISQTSWNTWHICMHTSQAWWNTSNFFIIYHRHYEYMAILHTCITSMIKYTANLHYITQML